jgi:hypothetical protein
MLFDHCAECRRCCHVDEGYPSLEITLTKSEKQKYKHICIETNCEHLGTSGCTLGDEKPFSCKLYPLVYDPEEREFYFDVECPLMPEYTKQLQNKNSEASLHLAALGQSISLLEKTDPKFLELNYEIDTDYFELQVLPVNPFSRDA